MIKAFYKSKKWAAWAYGGGALLVASSMDTSTDYRSNKQMVWWFLQFTTDIR